jgi:hypothetical protein
LIIFELNRHKKKTAFLDDGDKKTRFHISKAGLYKKPATKPTTANNTAKTNQCLRRKLIASLYRLSSINL